MATHRAMMPGPRPTTQSGQGNVVDMLAWRLFRFFELGCYGVMGLPHALAGARFGLGGTRAARWCSGAALSVGGVAPSLPKHSEALFTDEQRLPNPALKVLSLAAPVLVAAMAAAAGEILRGNREFLCGLCRFCSQH